MAGLAGEGLSTRPVLWQWLVDAIEQWTPLRQILGPLNGVVILESGASSLETPQPPARFASLWI